MHMHISAIGRARGSFEEGLCAAYLEQVNKHSALGIKNCTLYEAAARKMADKKARQKAEAALLCAPLPKNCLLIALDRQGQSLTSSAFAKQLEKWLMDAQPHVAFLIGGADGLANALLEQADMKLSLGPMTWPHLLARVMLAEQIWRAVSILAHHPYHRGD